MRKRGLFDSKTEEPYKLSRSKLELFLNCPLCFYLDRKLGISQPGSFPYSLNAAVDVLLKKEFDIHRAKKQNHPMLKHYKIDAIPFSHKKINEWRNNSIGIQVFHPQTNFLVYGAIDDIWITPDNELHIVDYKATAKNGGINLDADWQISYKRQMEIYQWLARHNNDLQGYKISNRGYFVYCNGKTDKEAFDGKLEFDVYILPYDGDDSWVKQTINDAYNCLISEELPSPAKNCVYCRYREVTKNLD